MINDVTNPTSILDFINSGGIVALLLLFILACHRKWLVFGWQYREKVDELKETRASQAHWQNIALRSTNLVETLADLSKTQTPPL
jgi:hypothetical protein